MVREKRVARVSATHPLVGTWEEEPKSGRRTTVIFTVSVKRGKFVVSGKDGEDGTTLKISQVKWNGESLRFTSFYPPGQHWAKNVLSLRSQEKMKFEVSGTYRDGEPFCVSEVWRKRRGS